MPFSVYSDWKETWPASGSETSHWAICQRLEISNIEHWCEGLGKGFALNLEDWT